MTVGDAAWLGDICHPAAMRDLARFWVQLIIDQQSPVSYPPWNYHSTQKWRFPIGISFSRGVFSGAMSVSGRVYNLAKPVLQLFGMQEVMTWQMVRAKFIDSLMRNEATTSEGEIHQKSSKIYGISAWSPWDLHAQILIPIGSMYGIFTYIWLIFMVNVAKYTIHGYWVIGIPKIHDENPR